MTILASMPPWPVPGSTASCALGSPRWRARVWLMGSLVAVADHDQRRPGVAGEVGDGEGGLLAVHPVQLGLHDREVIGSVGATAPQ